MSRTTPRALRDAAEKLERQAARDLAEAAALREAARQIEALETSRLTQDPDSTTLDEMSSAISSADFARGVSRSKHKDHPWLKVMYHHKDPAKRMTVTAWAIAHGKEPGTVASWLSKRRIPLSVAKTIEEEYGVKATLKNWPQGISAD